MYKLTNTLRKNAVPEVKDVLASHTHTHTDPYPYPYTYAYNTHIHPCTPIRIPFEI